MDDIQRKLSLIDKQLAGGAAFQKQIIGTAPLFLAATGLIVGILIQNTADWPVGLWLTLLALCAAGTLVSFVIQKESGLPAVLAYAALICFACLGGIRLTSFYQARPNDIRNLVTDERKLATIRGLIITEPYVNANPQWAFVRFKPTDPTSSFYLKVDQVQTLDGWAKVTGIVRVQVDEPVRDLKVGDYVEAYCWLDRFNEPTNPGQFNTARYLARRNVFIAASVKSRDGIRWLKGHRVGVLTRVRTKVRETATQALLGSPVPESPSEGLLQALLLGYRRNIDSDTYQAFRKTGLLHFISLSGMHLGILIGIIWWSCKTAGLMKRARAIVCIIAIGIFLLVVPLRAPTLRAAIIGWVFCISFFFRRRPNSLNTLSLAAIILLLIRPTQLFEAGWQLSFASVLGIILFADRIYFFIYQKIRNTAWFKKSPESELFSRIIRESRRYILGMFSVGLAAWFGGAGILLYHFCTINPFTSMWTVVVFPFVALILTFGYFKIILSLLLPTLAALLGVIVNFLSDSLIWIVERIAGWHIGGWNISQILVGHVPLALIILYYCLILFVAFVYFRRPLLKKAVCVVTALTLVLFLGVAKWQRTHRDNLVLTCLDVGHGQAILAQLPGKANVLFDAGSLHKSDIGSRTVAPFLDYIGISKIDAIIISHNDVDHINGIPEIVGQCKVRHVYANDAFFADMQADPCGTAGFLNRCLKDPNEKGLKIKRLGGDLNLSSGVDIKMLWPGEHISQYDQLSDNDKSLVSLIEFAGTKILLCSDIERFAQTELLRLNPDLKADIVIAPHHGSVRTLEPDFLQKLGADILICSCSRTDHERRQASTQRSETKWLYTAKDGALTVCINKDGTIKVDVFVE